MRNTVFQLLSSDPGINALGITAQNLFSGDPDSLAAQFDRYAVIRWGETQEGIQRSPMKRRIVTVWYHTRIGTYADLDSLLRRTRTIFEAVTGQITETGWINQMEWETDSGDLEDDGSRTILKTTTFSILASGI